LTFEEQAAEFHRLEAVALSMGLSHSQFERIAMQVNAEGLAKGLTPEEQLAEIRRRITKGH
jgi:hypothetical protein